MRMHQGSVMSPLLSAVIVDVATEFTREGALREFLYADDLVMKSETIEGLTNKFLSRKKVFEREALKVNLRKINVMVNGSNMKKGSSKCRIDPCLAYSLRVKVNAVLCVQCGKCIHGQCAGVKMVILRFVRKICMQIM